MELTVFQTPAGNSKVDTGEALEREWRLPRGIPVGLQQVCEDIDVLCRCQAPGCLGRHRLDTCEQLLESSIAPSLPERGTCECWRLLDSTEVIAVALRAVFRVQRLAGGCLRCR